MYEQDVSKKVKNETWKMTALTLDEAAGLFGEPGKPSMSRARAFMRWLWREADGLQALPQQIDGISRRALARLQGKVVPPNIAESQRQHAADGTIKLLFSADGHPVESVMIPGRGRATLCISSQSGCSRKCAFCATAMMGFRRNLTAGEIVAQVLLARACAPKDLPVRNVVFMGMGEPMDNLEPVLHAIDVLSTPCGPAVSPSHITVSTCGVLPTMRTFVARCNACLAISLNGTTEAQRRAIMPVDRKWSIDELLSFIREHGDRRLFFIEYILMKGLNDALDDARRLIRLLEGLQVRVNLIPFNPHPDSTFSAPSPDTTRAFFEILNQAGVPTMVRQPRGQDIAAACGQLYRRIARDE